MKFILIFLLSFGVVFAYIPQYSDYNSQIRILKELDIDPSFIKNVNFLSMVSENSMYRRDFLFKMKRRYINLSMLKEVIRGTGMPRSFLYLAMVESGLSNNITSNAKAVGIWQFMQETAKLYGLRVDRYVDERKDPIASTHAAVRYLNDLKAKFGKWYLAFIAYNCGEFRLKKAIAEAKTDDFSVLIDPKKNYLPRESRIFVQKILTAANIAKDADFMIQNDSSLLNSAGRITVTKVVVPPRTSLVDVANSINMDLKALKEYNSHLRTTITPPEHNYYIYIPINKKDIFASNFKSIRSKHFNTYIVQENDTLLSIANKFKVSINEIKKYNDLSKIKQNQNLLIPIKDAKMGKKITSYKVQKGDNLTKIAKKFGVKVDDIMQLNAMSKLAAGESIVIPR